MTLGYKEVLLGGKKDFHLMSDSSSITGKLSFLFVESGDDLMHGLLVCGQHCMAHCGKATQLFFMNDEIFMTSLA